MENSSKPKETKTTHIGMAAAQAAGSKMQVSAHSQGLMFENATSQQQNNFQIGLSASVIDIKKIFELKTKQHSIVGVRNSRFSTLDNRFE